jgi:hypothetical protein
VAAKPSCKTRAARVYQVPEYVKGVQTKRHVIYACVFRSGRTTTLTQPPRVGLRQGLSNFALAGTILAYSDYEHGIDSGCTSIQALDLGTGQGVVSASEVGCTVDAGFIRLGEVTSLVVNESGARGDELVFLAAGVFLVARGS